MEPNANRAADPIIAMDEIQGDVLLGLTKKWQVFVFFAIKDKAAFKKQFAHSLLKEVTTTRQVQADMARIAAHKQAGHTDLLPIYGFNVAFTHRGLETLTGVDVAIDTSFKAGAKAQALAPGKPPFPGINDPQDANKNLTTWRPEYVADNIDGVMLFTGPQREGVVKRADDALADLGADAAVELRRELGNVRPGLEDSHEHFGYLDGVSQPGVRGLTHRTDPATRPNQGLPGQELLWPGQFVFGYPAQVQPAQAPNPPIPDEFAPGPAPSLPDNLKWMENGSFMVFRRLNQLVPEFHAFSADQGASLQVDPTLLEARMVGRWKSGAPLEITPLQDDPVLAKDTALNNDFVFSTDQFQRACPYAAHIRKANPRDDEVVPTQPEAAANAHAAVLVRRIMRAGIAFGEELTPAEAVSRKTKQERGLLFVCYQTSIPAQFEFVQTAWVNNPTFVAGIPVFGKTRPDGKSLSTEPGPGNPFPEPGFDPLIGQADPIKRARTMDEPLPNFPIGNLRSTLTMPTDFITPTGGSYAFVPSINALKTTLLETV